MCSMQFAACSGSPGPTLVPFGLQVFSAYLPWAFLVIIGTKFEVHAKNGLVMHILTTTIYVLPACYLPNLALTTHPSWRIFIPPLKSHLCPTILSYSVLTPYHAAGKPGHYGIGTEYA